MASSDWSTLLKAVIELCAGLKAQAGTVITRYISISPHSTLSGSFGGTGRVDGVSE